jgi:hypothetical protein
MIRANMAEPMWRQVPRALGWMLNYLFTGTLVRVYRASYQYGIALTTFQTMLIWWLLGSALAGWLIGWLVMVLPMGRPCSALSSMSSPRSFASAAASARRSFLRGADQQPLAVPAGIRTRRAVLLGPLHRGRGASPGRDRASRRRRRDRHRRPQRRRVDRAGRGGARA